MVGTGCGEPPEALARCLGDGQWLHKTHLEGVRCLLGLEMNAQASRWVGVGVQQGGFVLDL